ncbi:MAG: DUF3231 family protein [Thermoanaerobacteraceae bacterium]|nr:DUF3231 family protein [Thermoanaerobacteraceae bacterium]
MQIGNIHIGKAEKAKPTVLDAGEAHVLWNHLLSRYDIIEYTQIWENCVHDPDFKYFLRQGLMNLLERQVGELEKMMDVFKLPLPYRPPKSSNVPVTGEVFNDRFIFRSILTGIENVLSSEIHAVRTTISNDGLRKMFIRFITEELRVFDDLCKYGKLKGWLQVPPKL